MAAPIRKVPRHYAHKRAKTSHRAQAPLQLQPRALRCLHNISFIVIVYKIDIFPKNAPLRGEAYRLINTLAVGNAPTLFFCDRADREPYETVVVVRRVDVVTIEVEVTGLVGIARVERT